MEYRYMCRECGEEVIETNPNLQDCPYCMHQLSLPIRLPEEDATFRKFGIEKKLTNINTNV